LQCIAHDASTQKRALCATWQAAASTSAQHEATLPLLPQGCFPWYTDKQELAAKQVQGKEINGKSNNLNNW
jgi:hypothetical protein